MTELVEIALQSNGGSTFLMSCGHRGKSFSKETWDISVCETLAS